MTTTKSIDVPKCHCGGKITNVYKQENPKRFGTGFLDFPTGGMKIIYLGTCGTGCCRPVRLSELEANMLKNVTDD